MTLTVRSASVTGATTASRALTHAEMDANWDHLVDYTRRMAFSGQYSSTTNFNTAQAALTDILGVSALRVGAGGASELQITFPTQTANTRFSISVGGGTFNGQFDPTMGWGYNPGRENTSEPLFSQTIEGHYYDGSSHWMEVNWSYTSSDGLTADKRPYGLQVNRTTHKFNHQWAAEDGFLWSDTINGTPLMYMHPDGIGINTNAATAGRMIYLTGSHNKATSSFSVYSDVRYGSGVTNAAGAFVGAVGTLAAAFTLPVLEQFAATSGTKGAGSAITVEYGFRCVGLVNGVSNYAFSGELSSGSGVRNLSMTGTADNFLEGKVQVGATAETANGTGTVTVGNLAPGTSAVVIKEWWTLKDSSGNTRYIPLFGV